MASLATKLDLTRNFAKLGAPFMPKKTLQTQFAEGLIALGFERVGIRAARGRLVYRRTEPGASNWYVGKAGSVRIGKNFATSHPISEMTKMYLLSAPEVQPLVRGYLKARAVDVAAANATTLAEQLAVDHPDLQAIEPRIVLTHVSRWLKEQRTGSAA